MSKKSMLSIATILLVFCLWVVSTSRAEESGNRVKIYSQWGLPTPTSSLNNATWYNIPYGISGEESLFSHGCGIFALAHAAQWLGIEAYDAQEELPLQYSKEYTDPYTYNGGDVCFKQFADKYCLDWVGVQEKNSYIEMLSTSNSVTLLGEYYNSHWVLGVDISSDKTKVLVLDSCAYPASELQRRTAYQHNAVTDTFSVITDWSKVTLNGNTGNYWPDFAGGAQYWISVDDAVSMQICSVIAHGTTAYPNTIDFGTIYEGYKTTARRILTVQNDGSQTVLLDDLRQPENFTFKDFSKTELAPGESATIVVEPNIGLKDGIYDVQVNLSTDIIVMSEPVELKLTVKEKPALPYTEPCPECLGNNLLLVESYMGNWTDNGDGTHSGLAQLTYDIICVDCAMWITNVVASDSTTYTMMHSFEDGVCTDCGLNLIKCDHGIGAYESLGYNQINRDPTVCLNEEFHYLPYTMTETFECTICGERFEETWDMEIDEAHDYDEKGLCSCGAKGEPTTCKHENIEQRMMDENAVYSNITETEHTKVADAYSVNWCLDCETRRTHQLWTPGQVTIERHSFADGICVCGYDNRCIHEFVDGVCCICGKHYLDNVNRIYTLPVGMRIVREEAFLGCPAEAIIISEGCTEIEKRAFAECIALKYVALPASIKMIADDAFDGCEGVTIFAPEGSLAHLYAAEKGFVWYAK